MKNLVRWVLLFVAAFCGFTSPASADDALQIQLAAAQWEAKATGIERLAAPAGDVVAYRLAQDKVTARVLGQLKAAGSPVSDVAAQAKAALTINGGYFWIKPNGALAPTGLLIIDGTKQAPLNTCQACTALLYSDARGLHITRPSAFRAARGVDSALQVGPMLVERGHVMAYKADGPAAARTAVCLSGGSIIVLLAMRELTLHDLAALLAAKRAEGGFDCAQAINLDGGASSQLVADLPGDIERLGLPRPVQNVLAFFQR